MANQEKLAMDALEEVSGGVSREAVINAVSKGWKVSKQFVSDNYGKILAVLGLMAVSYEIGAKGEHVKKAGNAALGLGKSGLDLFKSMFKTTAEEEGERRGLGGDGEETLPPAEQQEVQQENP